MPPIPRPSSHRPRHRLRQFLPRERLAQQLGSQRRFAVGTVVGAVVAALVALIARPFELTHIPIWLPPLPFALVAITLFCFGALAWFWGED